MTLHGRPSGVSCGIPMDAKSPPATHDSPLPTGSPSVPCSVFIDPPADGALNMAVDETLLELAANEGRASLRFYQWREPTLSLGYFQAYADRAMHAASSSAPVVRRLSGGGALMHDRELTYSMCLPRSHPLSRQSAHLYGVAHSALLRVLAQLGIHARMHNDRAEHKASDHSPQDTSEHFLCFARRTAADVVAESEQDRVKIVGSAQRRRRGAVLQHGALLLDASKFAPELPGLHQVNSQELDLPALIAAWCDHLADQLGLVMIPARDPSMDTLHIQKSLLDRYASPSWTALR
jgi:lipoate-protein ligase A